jgi:hyperosmotically inducible periplasmic protein
MTWWKRAKGRGGMILALLVLVSVASTSAQPTIGETIDNALITATVKARLAADPTVSAFAIDVDTADGVVSLTGVVNDEQARQRAIQLAQETEGVKRVETQNLRLAR